MPVSLARGRRHRPDRRLGRRSPRGARASPTCAGCDPDAEALARRGRARRRRRRRGSLEEAVGGADLAVVAAPVARLPQSVAAVLAERRRGDRHRRRLDEGRGRPRGARRRALRRRPPGLRLRGARPEHARAELFEGATWFLTPVAADRRPSATATLHGFVASLGAVPGRGRPRGARPARRAHEPPAARARERARQPGGRARGSRGTSRSRPPAGRCGT